MKKGFTLVELLAVLIILGIILAIIIPVVNNVLNDSKKSAYDKQVDTLLDQALRYSTENKLGYENNNYKTLEFQDLLDYGLISELPLNPLDEELLEGCIVYSWKEENKQYEFLYDENCNVDDLNDMYRLDVDFVTNSNSVNGCYNTDVLIDIVTNGDSVKYCYGISSCNPDVSGDSLTITNVGNNIVCAIGYRGSDSSDVLCEEFKVDNFKPVITPKFSEVILEENTSFNIKDYFDVVYGPSGGDYTCNYTNTSQLSSGNNNVTCTATSNSGLETSVTVNFKVREPNLMMSGYEFQNRIGNYRDTITEVNFLDSFSGKYETATIKWDFSKNYNEVVLGYIEEIDGKQILNIEADGVIIAHENLGGSCNDYSAQDSMFCYFRKLEAINFNNNFNTSNVTNMSRMFNVADSLTSLDLSGFNTSNVTDMRYMFSDASSLISLDLSSFDTSNVTNMSSMFYYESDLTNLNLSNFDTSSVTNMSGMFADTAALTTLDISNFDTSNVTNMSFLFSMARSLTSLDVSSFNTSKVTNMERMFFNTRGLTTLDLSNFNTSNVTDMSGMFYLASGLVSLDLSSFDTSNVTDMFQMFASVSSLTSLDVSSFDTSKVTSMSSMFNGASSLVNLDLRNFDTSKVTNMGRMFYITRNLVDVDLSSFDTSNVKSMSGMFTEASSLISLDLSSFDTSNVTDMSTIFTNSGIKTVYARTQEDADKFNATSYKPINISIIVKP